ncbi:MAG: tail fiber domain-containing protein [Phycisphaeraceae bacterium]|nr:MAG: tail fiber domain-containing protein [Phycisphaeraceae bacterium]
MNAIGMMVAAMLSVGVPAAWAQPVNSAFTLQGELLEGGMPASGVQDLRFRLFDAAVGGAQVGPTLCVDDVLPLGGRFTVVLDFGAVFAGGARYLEVEARDGAARTCATGTGFTVLSPRQPLTASPHAAYSISSGNAGTLGGFGASHFLNAGNLTGTLADARLSGNVSLLSGSQTFTGSKTFSSPPVFSAGGAPFSVSSTTRVTNLNADLFDNMDSAAFSMVGHLHDASAIASGTLADARLSGNVARRNADNQFSGTQAFMNPAGFGTLTPLAEVHVANVSGNADVLIKRNDAGQGFNVGVSGTPNLFVSRSDGTVFTDIVTINGSTDRVGIGTSAPEARLDIRGVAGDDPLRVRVDGSTKFRLYANGGAAVGANPASVPADGLYVHGSVGVGTLTPASAVHAVSVSGTGAVVTGESTAESGTVVGVYGKTQSGSGVAVNGESSAAFGTPIGVRGLASGLGGRGVVAISSSTSGNNFGVHASVNSSSGTAVGAFADAATGQTTGVRATASSPDGLGGWMSNSSQTGNAVGVRGDSFSTTGRAVMGFAQRSTGVNYGVWGESNSASGFDFYAAGAGLNYGSASSRRWKSDIREIADPLGKIAELRGVYYTWDAAHGGTRDIGFIAEEVGAVLPEIVRYEANGVDAIGMDYAMMTPLLVEAVKALKAERDALEARVRRLEDALRALGVGE